MSAVAPPHAAAPRTLRRESLCARRQLRCAAASGGDAPRVVLAPTPRCKTLRGTRELHLLSFVVGSGADATVRVENDAAGKRTGQLLIVSRA
jgi:hypothetical protein